MSRLADLVLDDILFTGRRKKDPDLKPKDLIRLYEAVETLIERRETKKKEKDKTTKPAQMQPAVAFLLGLLVCPPLIIAEWFLFVRFLEYAKAAGIIQ
jgi:hypothetical protein